VPTRDELERRVDELAEQYDGAEFAEAVRAYSETLDDAGRAELKAVLLLKARAFEDAVSERFEAKGWFRRQFGRIGDFERRNPEP